MNLEVARQQARDENTAPAVLAELANSKDYIILQNVAANVNTPPDILCQLGDMPLEELVEGYTNLGVSLFSRELRHLERFYHKLEERGCSTTIIKQIEAAVDIYRFVARNPNTPVEYLGNIGSFFPEDFLDNPILDLLILSNSDFLDSHFLLQIELAKNRKTPVQLLEYLLKRGSYGTRKYLAANANTTVEMLELMAADGMEKGILSDETLVAIAQNSLTPPHVLGKLVHYGRKITQDPLFLSETARKFKHDFHLALANNPNTPKQ